MPYACSDSFVIMPVSKMHTMLYRDRPHNIVLKLFGTLSSCELHLACCLPCCAAPLSKVRVISQYSFTQLPCCGDGSLNQIVVTVATGCCQSKPQRQPALLTHCEGVCSTLSRPWQPKQSKSSSFMIMNRTSGTDLRCLAEPHHH